MALTLSHQSALDAVRMLRAEGVNLHEVEKASLVEPSAWLGTRLSARNFDAEVWRWLKPSARQPLHVLVPNEKARLRGACLSSHAAWGKLPADSILWLDEHTRAVCPELLFLQMAQSFSLPALVMLGMELCGHFSRWAYEPLMGAITDGLPTATSVGALKDYLAEFTRVRGLAKARAALECISGHAFSAPEAVLATMYALPPSEHGYGLGPVLLNEQVSVGDSGPWERAASRYPDLMFGFAPVGINYDGSMHFDLSGILAAADAYARAEAGERDGAREELRQKLEATRAKTIDDNVRNRQLAAQGRIVFPATKEDLLDGEHLDKLTKDILGCARMAFGVDTSEFEQTIDDTSLSRDRWDLFQSLMPRGRFGQSSYGRM